MFISGITSSILSGLTGSQHVKSKFEQVRDEFKQLGQDLQSGNLSQAQQDFTALSQNLPGASQSGTIQAASQVSSATGATGTTGSSTSSLLQEFNQLGQALQSGNLQAAQQDYTGIQQTVQQSAGTAQPNAQPAGGHHLHHHHVESSEGSPSSASSSSQQTNSIDHSLVQAFSQLAQTLRSGNIQGAQQAFTALQADLQQIGGFVTSASAGSGSTAASTAVGSLNVSA
jgi:hypothetical protein